MKNIYYLLVLACVFSSFTLAHTEEEQILPPPALVAEMQLSQENIDVSKDGVAWVASEDERSRLVVPVTTELWWENGVYKLYAYYLDAFSVTVLSGYDTGCQSFYDNFGIRYAHNDYFNYVIFNGQTAMEHFYNDGCVYTTDSDQAILLY